MEMMFRRIRGRIVPIKKKNSKQEQRRDLRAGAALTTAGIATASTSGFVAGKLFKSAQKTSASIERSVDVAADLMVKTKKSRKTGTRVPKGQMSFAALQIEDAAKKVPKYKRKVFLSAKTYKFGALSLGGILLGEGLSRLSEAGTKRESGSFSNVTTAATGTAAVFLANRSFRVGAGSKLLKLLKKRK